MECRVIAPENRVVDGGIKKAGWEGSEYLRGELLGVKTKIALQINNSCKVRTSLLNTSDRSPSASLNPPFETLQL